MHSQLQRVLGIAVVCLFAVSVAAAQVGSDGAFQVHYASGLITADTILNYTNTGASWGIALGNGVGLTNNTGSICLNVYVFSPDEQLQECCAFTMSPNSLYSSKVLANLESNPAFGVISPSVVIKLLATSTQGTTSATAAGCDASTAGNGQFGPILAAVPPFVSPTNPSYFVPGLAAWARVQGLYETPFTNATLSFPEWQRMTQLCGFLKNQASGAGICTTPKTPGGQ
jgi:hypothetical protein